MLKKKCYHDWSKVCENILPSAYDQLKEYGNMIERITDLGAGVMFRKKLVVILKCQKCGKLDKTIESNP